MLIAATRAAAKPLAMLVAASDTFVKPADDCCKPNLCPYTSPCCLQPIVQAGDKCRRMYMVAAGTVMHRGRWYMHGELLGAHLFLPEGEFAWTHSASTLTFSTLISLDKETFHRSACKGDCARCKHAQWFTVRILLTQHLQGSHPVRTAVDLRRAAVPFMVLLTEENGPSPSRRCL